MKAEKIKIELGLKKTLNVAHLTDIHLCLADERDAHLIDHAKERANVFYEEASCPEKTPSEYFREALEYSEKNCDTCVITGDVIDFISAKNLEESEEILSGKCDDIPEQCFLMCGTIDEVYEKARVTQNEGIDC